MGLGGLVLSLAVFILYAAGLIPPGVPASESAALWSEPSGIYLEETGLGFTSGWFLKPENGYVLCTAALAVLASTALPTLGALAVFWFRRRDFLYGAVSLVIMGVLILAVTGT